MAHDLSTKTNREIRNWISNHEEKGVTDTEFYRSLLDEYARRTGRGLNVDTSLAHLMDAAKTGKFTTYGDLAKASEISWSKARYAMNGPLGHLDQLLSICHARGLPLFSSLCVNQEGRESGELGPEALKGFVHGAERLGYTVVDGDQFLRKCQKQCMNWGKQNGCF